MKHFIFFISLFSVIGCKQDPPIIGNCDLSVLDGITFTGNVRWCNASGNQQNTIPALASLVVVDSLFILSIVDTDSVIDYQLLDTAIVRCVYWEGNEHYALYEYKLFEAKKIGMLSTYGTLLHWDIRYDPCPESTAFIGFKD